MEVAPYHKNDQKLPKEQNPSKKAAFQRPPWSSWLGMRPSLLANAYDLVEPKNPDAALSSDELERSPWSAGTGGKHPVEFDNDVLLLPVHGAPRHMSQSENLAAL